MNTDHEPAASTYLGLFFVALATVMYEIVLTRIFSVTMWYHFAFVAISIAMFGMTVGAVIVYLRPKFFTQERVTEHLAWSAVLFAVSAVVSFLISIFVPFDGDMSVSGVASTGLTYAIISVPFVFSGVCVALALTKFPRRVGTLYAADLIGAAVGCLWVIVTLNVTDGPTAVIVVGSLAGLSAALFAARAAPAQAADHRGRAAPGGLRRAPHHARPGAVASDPAAVGQGQGRAAPNLRRAEFLLTPDRLR